MASPKIERLSKTLSQPGMTLAQRHAAMNHVVGSGLNPYEGLVDLEKAITLVKDEEIRADLGRHLWAQLNAPRFIYGGPLPKMASVVSAAIFTLDDASLLSVNGFDNPLEHLTGPLDDRMFSIKDPLQPGIEPLILVAPFALLDFERAVAMNYMLGNPKRTEADKPYAEMWISAMQATSSTLNTLAFIFLTTQEGSTLASATRSDSRPGAGERTHQILDMITAHADRLNRSMPGLNMQLVELTSFSSAVMHGCELRIRKTLRDQKHLVGAYCTEQKEYNRDTFMGDVLREAEEKFREEFQGKAQDPAETYGKAVLGLVNSPEVGQQLGQCLMLSVHGVPNIAMNVTLPQGVTSSMLGRWWREEIDPEGRAEMIFLPSVLVKELPQGRSKSSQYRDANGEWCDIELLRIGKDGRELFRTASWASAVKASEVAVGTRDALIEVPHPRLMLQTIDLENGVRSHFQPPVAQTLLRLAAQPGRSYGWMREEMTDAHIGLATAQMFLPHPTDAFMPEGFWAPLHFEKAGGVVFKVRSSLQEALGGSDLKGGFPLHLLRSPYPDIYIQFAKPMPLDKEVVLGAYCSDYTLSDAECADTGSPVGSRVFEMIIVTTHQGGLSPLQLTRSFLIAPGDDRELVSIVREALSKAVQDSAGAGEPIDVLARAGEAFQNVLTMVMKVLLYVGMKSARMEHRLDRANLLLRAKEARGSERDKLSRKAAATYDQVIIGPEAPEWVPQGHGKATHTVAVWPVRGYFMSVRFGPGRQQVRSDWMPPSFRHRHSLDGDDSHPKPKDYIVK